MAEVSEEEEEVATAEVVADSEVAVEGLAEETVVVSVVETVVVSVEDSEEDEVAAVIVVDSVEEEVVVTVAASVVVDLQEGVSEDVDHQEEAEDPHVVDVEVPVECEEERLSWSNHIVSEVSSL